MESEVYPAWTEHGRVLMAAIRGSDLLRPPLVQVRSESGWEAVTSFCHAVMLVKEETERMRQQAVSMLSRP